MAYPTQAAALARMEKDTLRASRLAEERAVSKVAAMWERTRAAIKAAIREEYLQGFPGGEVWSLPRARANGTMLRIQRRVHALLDGFNAAAIPFIRSTLSQAKQERKLRAAWMLDMTTPPAIHPKLSGVPVKAREAGQSLSGAVRILSGAAARQDWTNRWGTWLNGYAQALNTNLELGALNDSTPEQAGDAADTARPGPAAVNFWDVLDRLLRSEMLHAEADGYREFAAENEEHAMVEIWQAHDDARVCEDCAYLDQSERTEDSEEPPLHPRCRCYWRMVPRAWADYMKDVDPDAAHDAELRGVPPGGMAMRDPETGKLMGMTYVEFFDWKGNLVATY